MLNKQNFISKAVIKYKYCYIFDDYETYCDFNLTLNKSNRSKFAIIIYESYKLNHKKKH